MSAPTRNRFDNTPRVGVADWAIRKQHALLFPTIGSHLERYSRRFNAVEINESKRPALASTYKAWAASVFDEFLFSVKIPEEITYGRRLADSASLLEVFLSQVFELELKLGVLLVQLPPNLAFDRRTADAFFSRFRSQFAGNIVCEPRHESWFSATAEELLIEHWVARAAADPAIVPTAAEPGGWPDVRYYRLHGSPRKYRSKYDRDRIAAYAERIRAAGGRACAFSTTPWRRLQPRMRSNCPPCWPDRSPHDWHSLPDRENGATSMSKGLD